MASLVSAHGWGISFAATFKGEFSDVAYSYAGKEFARYPW